MDERRAAQRFPMRIPLRVRCQGDELPGFTRDISTRGVFFLLEDESQPKINEDVEFIITFPPEVTLTTSLRVRCNARIVRALKTWPNQVGIAAEIHHYQFLHAAADA